MVSRDDDYGNGADRVERCYNFAPRGFEARNQCTSAPEGPCAVDAGHRSELIRDVVESPGIE